MQPLSPLLGRLLGGEAARLERMLIQPDMGFIKAIAIFLLIFDKKHDCLQPGI